MHNIQVTNEVNEIFMKTSGIDVTMEDKFYNGSILQMIGALNNELISIRFNKLTICSNYIDHITSVIGELTKAYKNNNPVSISLGKK